MKPALLRYLRCPYCHCNFELKSGRRLPISLSYQEKQIIYQKYANASEYEMEVLTGVLICMGCGISFPVRQGVPRIFHTAEKGLPLNQHFAASGGKFSECLRENAVQTSFSREWDEFKYEDQTIWLWSADQRLDTFCEEIGIPSPEELQGKLMIDAGCGSGVLSINLATKYLVEIIAFDMSDVVARAFQANRSNLCHFVQASVFTPPLAGNIADLTYSHGVLHHTSDPRRAFDALARLSRAGGLFYVWLYGRKKGWNRFRFVFIRAARTIISRLPEAPQTVMIRVMASLHRTIHSLKRLVGMKSARYRSNSQFLVGIRDKYTPLYAKEHEEDEIKNWFLRNGYIEVERRNTWEKTKQWTGSTDLAIKGRRQWVE
ncbi:MAG: methyltransferase domain-containing protein [bacterium]